jgi:hypothetical protein
MAFQPAPPVGPYEPFLPLVSYSHSCIVAGIIGVSLAGLDELWVQRQVSEVYHRAGS